MSSYLEAYGASEERRASQGRLIKRLSIALGAVLIAGVFIYAALKNHAEEQQATTFVTMLKAHDYTGAYGLWGCTDAHPCPNYPLKKFMEDWGPNSPHADQSSVNIGVSQSCGTGVVIRLDYKGSVESVPLFIERGTKIVSFAPWPECPGKHLHIGAWLRSVFNR